MIRSGYLPYKSRDFKKQPNESEPERSKAHVQVSPPAQPLSAEDIAIIVADKIAKLIPQQQNINTDQLVKSIIASIPSAQVAQNSSPGIITPPTDSLSGIYVNSNTLQVSGLVGEETKKQTNLSDLDALLSLFPDSK